jgi:hypothetical protein
MKDSTELTKFNTAMDSILRADPKVVKESMEAEHKANAEARKAKGERKRGRPRRKGETNESNVAE